MYSYTSSNTDSLLSNDDLNQARIQGDDTLSLSLQSTQLKQKKSNKKQLIDNEEYNFRESISQFIRNMSQQQEVTTPQSKKHNKKIVDLTKTMTIKGKKGKLYQDICPVCLSQYSFPIGALQCRHKFCFDCIEQWSKTSTNCPCCRKKFNNIVKKDQKSNITNIKVEDKQMIFNEEDYFICYVCGSGDNQNVLLICDMCDFYCCHIFCDPSLNNTIPEGQWFCRNCQNHVRLSQNSAVNTISAISYINSSNQQQQEQEDKPIAARTRSRVQQTHVSIFRRLRRRR